MSLGNFFKKSLIGLVLFLLIYLGLLGTIIQPSLLQKKSFLIGFLIAYGNALIGFALLSWGFKRSQKDFMISVYGGMFFRILLIFSLLFILIRAFKISQIYMIVSLILFYFIFMILEIFEVHKNAQRSGNTI